MPTRSSKIRFVATLLGVAQFALATDQSGPAAPPPPRWLEAAKAVVEAERVRVGAPGLSVAIGVGDAMPLACGFGVADLENEVPATGQTVYRLASISKPVTAVCAMALVERGRLDLDRPVHEFVPGWGEKRWPVTTRLLLAHLGGVRHYRRGEGESTVHYADQTSALARFGGDPLVHEPGTKYLYSTYGFNLVAAAVEQAAGLPFPDVVREIVAGPSGAVSLQDDDVRRIIRGRAQGYVRRGGELQNSALMDGSYKLGGGGLCASAEDLVRFGQALADGKLVGRESLRTMWARQRTKDGEEIGYGLGFGVGSRDGRLEVSHSGAQSRVSTMFYLLPEDRLVIALMCNLEGVRLSKLAQRLADIALD